MTEELHHQEFDEAIQSLLLQQRDKLLMQKKNNWWKRENQKKYFRFNFHLWFVLFPSVMHGKIFWFQLCGIFYWCSFSTGSTAVPGSLKTYIDQSSPKPQTHWAHLEWTWIGSRVLFNFRESSVEQMGLHSQRIFLYTPNQKHIFPQWHFED